MTDVVRLDSARRRAGIPKKVLAAQIGASMRKFEKKMTNRAEFTAREIAVITKVLKLRPKERDDIFFGLCVDYYSTYGR